MLSFQRAAAGAAILYCVAGAASAAAQGRASDPPPIRIGETVRGSLGENDPRAYERGPFRAYRFQARQGQRLIATLRSDDFDAYLMLGRPIGGIVDQVDFDDDGGGGTDSRLRFTIPATGTYLLVAQSLPTDGEGRYTLALEPAPVPTTTAPVAISIGSTATGALAETDAMDDEEDAFYDTYTFAAQGGQRVHVVMRSDDFDAYLTVGRMTGGEFVPLKSDDDGAGGTNSRVRLVVEEAGEYVIRASSLGESVGSYSLSLEERAPATVTIRPVRADQTVGGSLDEDDASLDTDDSYYEYWTYAGRAGERLTITMRSEDFDTYLAFGRLADGEFTEIATDDDGAGGTDSRLEVTLPASGEYVVRANSLSPGETGRYSLEVRSAR